MDRMHRFYYEPNMDIIYVLSIHYIDLSLANFSNNIPSSRQHPRALVDWMRVWAILKTNLIPNSLYGHSMTIALLLAVSSGPPLESVCSSNAATALRECIWPRCASDATEAETEDII
ncbi:uncharacterized protein LOC127255821 isoform X2 [Andrographis paniculata]|nr:uncharacterized protein LOC127255821 isoform X2 [Andrographis paniculata]